MPSQRVQATSADDTIQMVHRALAKARDKQVDFAKPGDLRFRNGLNKALRQGNMLLLSQPPLDADGIEEIVKTTTLEDLPGDFHYVSNSINSYEISFV